MSSWVAGGLDDNSPSPATVLVHYVVNILGPLRSWNNKAAGFGLSKEPKPGGLLFLCYWTFLAGSSAAVRFDGAVVDADQRERGGALAARRGVAAELLFEITPHVFAR